MARPLEGLGEALLGLGRPAEALPHVERALALEMQNGTAARLARCKALLARAAGPVP